MCRLSCLRHQLPTLIIQRSSTRQVGRHLLWYVYIHHVWHKAGIVTTSITYQIGKIVAFSTMVLYSSLKPLTLHGKLVDIHSEIKLVICIRDHQSAFRHLYSSRENMVWCFLGSNCYTVVCSTSVSSRLYWFIDCFPSIVLTLRESNCSCPAYAVLRFW